MCQSSITGYITGIDQTLGTIRNAPNFTWRTRGPSQTTCDSNTHYTPLRYCSGAVKAASANVSQMINICVIKHCERDIPLTICCLNARSVKNKALSVADFVIYRDIDVLALSETWLGTDTDNKVINELVPSGYPNTTHLSTQ